MAANSAFIRPLPERSQAQLRSSVAITSLNDAVIGLLENSLDAGSSDTDIQLDYSKGYCCITDNGNGIPAEEFKPTGNLCSLHHTSKLDASQCTFGRYGSFLYHAGTLSFLTIISKQQDCECSLTIHRSKIIARSYNEIESTPTIFTKHGSQVVVRNLFGDVPVRYRHIAAQMENSVATLSEFSALKENMTAILLAYNRDVNVKVVELKTKQIYQHKATTCTNNTSRNWEGDPAYSFSIEKVCSILQQASYIRHSEFANWKTASGEASGISVNTAISLQPAPSKAVQFISIGHRPLIASSLLTTFLATINEVFENSTFGTTDNDVGLAENEHGVYCKDLQLMSELPSLRQIRGPKKAVDRWPMIYVRIDFQSDLGTARGNTHKKTHPSEKLIEETISLLQSVIREFLNVHNFYPRTKPRKKVEMTINDQNALPEGKTLLKRQIPFRTLISRSQSGPSVSQNDFHTWSRIKPGASGMESARMQCDGAEFKNTSVTDKTPSHPQTLAERIKLAQFALGEAELHKLTDLEVELLLEGLDGNFDDRETSETSEEFKSSDIHVSRSDLDEAVYLWIDPRTGIEHRINARNGLILPQVNYSNVQYPNSSNYFTSQAGSPSLAATAMGKRIKSKLRKRTLVELISSLRQSDLTRSFHHVESRIPSIVSDKHEQGSAVSTSPCCSLNVASRYFSTLSGSTFQSLTKCDLERAKVLSQVDQKFILIQSSPTNREESMLALIDQHAADERIKAEELYTRLCAGERTVLQKPIVFELPQQEIELLTRQQAGLMEWQITYEIVAPLRHIVVRTLPSLISERCRLDPKILIDLLRREIHAPSILSTTIPVKLSDCSAEWIHRMPYCPAGLVEMINSRACRSAIMFNDVLDRNQCQHLVTRLARCTLPFICAHGRPSCVILPAWKDNTNNEDEAQEVFIDGFKKWKSGRCS